MINAEDQESLFRLVSRYLKKDIVCWAFGGTAMIFYGYKTFTKDIDLLFETEEDKEEFIKAIKELGYEKKSLFNIYIEEKSKDKNAPLMFSRGDERFDLFVRKIFRTGLSEKMKKRFYARHDFAENKSLVVFVVSKEDIILLKAVTEREKDFEDILQICTTEKSINWDIIIEEAVEQYKKGDKFILMDIEETMKKLKKYIFIKKEYFDRLYNTAE